MHEYPIRRGRTLVHSALTALLCLGCASDGGASGHGQQDAGAADAWSRLSDEPAAERASRSLAGAYSVAGVTVLAAHGTARNVSGLLRLAIDGEHYTTDFRLETIYPVTEDENVPATIEGRGKGVVLGHKLAGIDSAILRLAPFEGDEQASGELEILSTAVADVLPDGRIIFRMQNELGPGQDYSPSVTIFEATLIDEPTDKPTDKPAEASDTPEGAEGE
jgi:hypothetical protein